MINRIVFFSIFAISVSCFAGLSASGPLKAFKGPTGELLQILEVNSSRQVLLRFSGVGGENDGKTRLLELEDLKGDKTVFYEVKRGSKKQRHVVARFRNKTWTLFNPTNDSSIQMEYSEVESQRGKAEDFLLSYNANKEAAK